MGNIFFTSLLGVRLISSTSKIVCNPSHIKKRRTQHVFAEHQILELEPCSETKFYKIMVKGQFLSTN